MKKYFLLSVFLVRRHLKMNLFLLIQIALILLGVNILAASYQLQSMLEEPLSSYLKQDGYYIHNVSDFEGIEIVNRLKGNKEIYTTRSLSNVFKSDIGDIPSNLIVYDDSFWKEYHPAMKRGTWNILQSKDIGCIVTGNCSAKYVQIPGSSDFIKIKGVLNDSTYIPSFTQWSRSGGLAENFYKIFHSENEELVYVLMPLTQWNKLNLSDDILVWDQYDIVVFSELSDEERNYNHNLLEANGNPAISLSVLYDRAEKAKKNVIHRFLPLMISLGCLAVFGLVCGAAIHMLQDLRVLSIYYLSGMKWNQCIILCMLQILIILILAIIISIITIIILLLTGVLSRLGLRFTYNNIIISSIICFISLIANCIIPYSMVHSKSPISLIRGTNI